MTILDERVMQKHRNETFNKNRDALVSAVFCGLLQWPEQYLAAPCGQCVFCDTCFNWRIHGR